jgi:hypothetical protein
MSTIGDFLASTHERFGLVGDHLQTPVHSLTLMVRARRAHGQLQKNCPTNARRAGTKILQTVMSVGIAVSAAEPNGICGLLRRCFEEITDRRAAIEYIPTLSIDRQTAANVNVVASRSAKYSPQENTN